MKTRFRFLFYGIIILLFLLVSCFNPNGNDDQNDDNNEEESSIGIITTGKITPRSRALTSEDVQGSTVTPEYFECMVTQLSFFNLTNQTTASNIAETGNDEGVIKDYRFKGQAVFKPGLENNLLESLDSPLELEPALYQAVVIQRMWSGYIHYDSDSSGISDYDSSSQYQETLSGLKQYRTLSSHFWKADDDRRYEVGNINYIVLLDKSLIQKYFLLNLSAKTASEVFEMDGSLKPTVEGYSQLTESEREIVSYISVALANLWGPDPEGKNFQNHHMVNTQQEFSQFLFIPVDPVDLREMQEDSQAVIEISWDLTDLVCEEMVSLGLASDDYVVESYSRSVPFKTLEDPYNYDNYDPNSGWSSAGYSSYKYFLQQEDDSYVSINTEELSNLPPDTPVFKKDAYLWEKDPFGGPMAWTVSVTITP